MSYEVFARKYRPKTFQDVLGQDHVVRTLSNAIEKKRLAHAYLFVGPRGTGKTSTARILAKALNCENGPRLDFDPESERCLEIAEGRSLDVLEIDGASNNGVEQVRELRETVRYAPANAPFKIYYIDEVHMLSSAAFNALLKTLEEPPPHVKFIFATTEPNKVLPTILSRCQRFDLRRIPSRIIADHLLHIAENEGVQLDEKAAFSIAVGADGGMRDAQSMLDQLVAFCGDSIQEPNVQEVFGFTGFDTVANMAGCLLNQDAVGALSFLNELDDAGKDLGKLLDDIIGHFRNLLVYRIDPEGAVAEGGPVVADILKSQSDQITNEQILALIEHFAEIDARMKWAPNKKLHMEVALIRAVQVLGETTLSDILNVLAGSLEGIPAPAPQASAVSPAPTTPVPPPSSPPSSPPPEKPAMASASPGPEPQPTAPSPAPQASPARQTPTPETNQPLAQAEPAPATPATPATLDPAVSAADLADVAGLWRQTIAQLGPVFGHYAAKGVAAGIQGRHFVVAFARTDSSSMESLNDDDAKASAESILEQLTGKKFGLQLKVDGSIQPPAAAPLAPPSNLPPAPPPESTEPVAPPRSESVESRPAKAAPAKKSAAEKPEPKAGEGDDFKNDPLIQAALERFEGVYKE